jgi:hypothetical protein
MLRVNCSSPCAALLFMGALGALCLSCSKKSESPAKTKTESASAPARVKETPKPAEETKPPSPALLASAAAPIGVAECDEYLAKYDKCIEKMPADKRAGIKQKLATMRESWNQATKKATDKSAFVTVCKQLLATSKETPNPFGCEW